MNVYRRKILVTRISALLVALPGVMPLAVLAQEVDGRENVGIALEEVIVTARRRAESIQTAPLSVSAFSSEAIERRNMTSAADVTNFVPNVQFDSAASESGGGASSQINIRGIGQTDYVITVEPGVGVYLDGVYVGKSMGSLLDTIDVERLEVLRGPQGTLFGKNTIGGAIQVFSKRPSETFEASADITVGSYDRSDFKGAVSGPVSNSVRMRASAASQNRDGFVKRTRPDGTDTGERQGDVDRLSGRFAVEVDLTPDVMATLSLDGTRIREQTPGTAVLKANGEGGLPGLFNAGVPGGVCLASAGPSRFSNPFCYNEQYVTQLDSYRTAASGGNKSDTDVAGGSLKLDWQLDGFDLTSISAYRDVQVDIAQDLYGSPYFYGFIEQDIDWSQFSQEFQISGDSMNDRLRYVGGVYYSREDATQRFPVDLLLVQFLSGGEVKNESSAVFGQVTYDLTSAWSLTVGGRYTRDEREFNPGLQQVLGYDYNPTLEVPGFLNLITGAFGDPGTPIFPAGWYKRTSTAFNPMASLSYNFSDDVMVYASAAEGFKGGGFTMRYFPPIMPDAGTDPDDIISYAGPEEAVSYELGLKSELFDRRLRLNIAAFFTDYEDIQVTYVIDPDGPGPIGEFVPVLANAGTAEIKGIEVEFSAAVTPWLTVDGSVGYIDAEYVNFTADALANFPNADSLELQNTPKSTANIGATLRLIDNEKGYAYARLDYSYRDEQFKEFSNDPALLQDSYNILGASVTYITPSEKWELTLGGSNLTDEAYIVSGETSSEYSRAVVSRPREWYARVKYLF